SPRPCQTRVALERSRRQPSPPALAPARASHESAAQTVARRNGIPFRVRRARHLANASGESVSLSGQRRYHGSPVSARRVQLRSVRRQLELARADLDAGELSHHRVSAKIPPLLRGRFQSRVSDRLRPFHHDPRSCGRTFTSIDDAVLERRRRSAARVEVSLQTRDRSALQRLPAVPRILSWRQRSRRRRFASNRLDGTRGEIASASKRSTKAQSKRASCKHCRRAPNGVRHWFKQVDAPLLYYV